MEEEFIMDIKEYQQYVNEGMSPNYDLKLATLGLVGEVGEVCDVIKKNGIYPDRVDDTSLEIKLIDELGDVAWQLFAVACTLGIPMTHILEYNVSKLNSRHGGTKLDTTGGRR